MKTIPTGAKVCYKNDSSIEGCIVSETVDIQGQTNYVIRLNCKTIWDVYISLLVIREDDIVLIKDFRN